MIKSGNALDDHVLIQKLQSVSGYQRIEIAALLGDAVGEDGPDVLRTLIKATGRGTRDLRCAAIISLAKRCGDSAAEDFIAILALKDATISEYAALALAYVKGSQAWPAIYSWFARNLRDTKRNRLNSETPVTFLAQNCTSGSEDAARLVTLLRDHWSRLTSSEVDWLSDHLPAIAPGGPAYTDIVMPAGWDRSINGLFDPLQMPPLT